MVTIGKCWKRVGDDLGLRVECPFKLLLQDGTTLEFDALVKDFGAPLGMLITTDYKSIKQFEDEIIEIGYGYSTMSNPSGYTVHDSEDYKHVLNDWGWSGDPALKPSWIIEPIDTESKY